MEDGIEPGTFQNTEQLGASREAGKSVWCRTSKLQENCPLNPKTAFYCIFVLHSLLVGGMKKGTYLQEFGPENHFRTGVGYFKQGFVQSDSGAPY